MILSIDPGLNAVGVALWNLDASLMRAFLVRGNEFNIHMMLWQALVDRRLWKAFTEIVVEIPQVYHVSCSKGDPNDLVALAFVAGRLVQRVQNGQQSRVVKYRPAEWKGQVPKEIHQRRTEQRLHESEREQVEGSRAVSLMHNVWDAIGLGLYHLRNERMALDGRRQETRRG